MADRCEECGEEYGKGPSWCKFCDGYTAGQAAERKRIEEAPRAWLGCRINGDPEALSWTKDGARDLLALDREPDVDGGEVYEVALVPLSPTPQQESE